MNKPLLHKTIFSLFSNHPEIQARYFALMSGGDVVRLGSHGGAVVAAVGAAVTHVKDGEDGKFVAAMRKVIERLKVQGNSLIGNAFLCLVGPVS